MLSLHLCLDTITSFYARVCAELERFNKYHAYFQITDICRLRSILCYKLGIEPVQHSFRSPER